MTSRGASIESLPETPSKKLARPCKHLPGEGWLQKGCFLCSILFRLGGERGVRRPQKCRQLNTFAPSRAGNGGRLEP